MCGISGFFGEGNVEELPRMLKTIRHRGPDDTHFENGKGFGLAACRLSIMDFEHGKQPMWAANRKICVAQNGEIYNAPELRKELAKKGYRFQGHCDTEVLAPLYQEYGESAWSRLEGMFAIGLWDQDKKRGYLIRDRCGKKPLYYTIFKNTLYFGSEIKSLLVLSGFPRKINPEAIVAYIGLKHIPGDASPFQNIYQIPQGCFLQCEANGKKTRIRKYWSLPTKTKTIEDPKKLVQVFLDILRKAVKERLLSDVPIGFFLSGGLDSSLVVALASELCGSPLKTFTLTLDEEHNTPGKEADKHWARYVAKRYGTDHQEKKVESRNIAKQMREVIRAFDEPFAGVISPYFLAQEMVKHVKVALCGDGADELFGSYLSHRLAASMENGPHAYKRTKQEEKLYKSFDLVDFNRWRSSLEVFTGNEMRALFLPKFLDGINLENQSEKRWEEASRPFVNLSPLNKMLSTEFVTVLPDQVLKYADRLSMAH